MNNKEKFLIRSSILELTETGTPRNISIDDKIKNSIHNENEREKTLNFWDCITALGAQLSRPPYDPYREIINLAISVGRRQCQNKVVLSMPLLIYDNYAKTEEKSLDALHDALNWLTVNDNTNLGFVSEKSIKNNTKRKYSYFKRIIGKSIVEEKDNDFEGLVLQYDDNNDKFIQFLIEIRKEFKGPILVEIDNAFDKNIKSILDVGADGIVVDTIKITNQQGKYKGKHAITVIHDVRRAINQYYTGKENDGAILVAAGDFNNAGRIVKAAALGTDIIGYSTSILIANAANNYENLANTNTISERIYRHMLATKGELKGIPAALGYSNFYNMSPSDLRTSSIEVSLQAEITIEGIDKSYRQIIKELVDEYEFKEGLNIDEEKKQKLVTHLLTNRNRV
ncbi:MAG: hypothetical protein ACTHJ2_10135 [Candidatus Nitrosocosmicus sp.]